MPTPLTDTRAPMPVVYLPHGGGPLPLLQDPAHQSLSLYLQSLGQLPTPEVILIISAHWEAPSAQFTKAERPELIFDYSGFPPETYQYHYPAPGAPERAAAWAERLNAAQIAAGTSARGWDHGCFVPLLLSHPQANIPVVQLSLIRGLNPSEHIALGAALAPLRHEGVLIIGSGLSFHNMAVFFAPSPSNRERSEAFDTWLNESLCGEHLSHQQRCERLINWQAAPQARFCHPREEHLLPLHVCLGAAQASPQAQRSYSDILMGVKVSGFTWW
ncbi:MAG TPA: class III extradiol ring-cleavage dioxygenase [Cellvibrionaceae bacterium]|nr:class III extradiol ring-cleavage dioxygenase [Cellvibrionaceae bacterium]HMW70587.1 class III extradiol ring-cleavage dioxygenase [Cellvibrionaceae bacterium]HMY38691.1 class III extradiol ring-cleavage dioxygenase [Marinagarivorans sp.]HNG59068.1 class III extradiol ring-cleavage dioxygenase [Cellvibrionaceae bacterium]